MQLKNSFFFFIQTLKNEQNLDNKIEGVTIVQANIPKSH